MTTTEMLPLTDLYERDETAWLEIMSELSAQGRVAEMDLNNLSEFLGSMAKRDRREVNSRLVVLLTHLLKWECQPQNRSGSWQATILEQRRQLRFDLTSGTLRAHALDTLAEAYVDARKQAAVETGLPRTTFPALCPWSVDDLLADDDESETERPA